MKPIKGIFYLSFLACLFSCKKEKAYRILGTLMNEVTGNSHNMGGECIQLLRIREKATFNIFSNPDKITIEAEAITNKEGHFDFGVNKLKQGDYRIEFVQGEGKTYYGVSNSFKDISLGKSIDFDEKISIMPTIGAISFVANPISTSSSNDTIFVEFVSETRLIKNPAYLIFGHSTGTAISSDPYHSFGGINNTEFMGNIFIKVTKSYNGFRSIFHDTLFVEKDERYKYYTPF